MVKIEESYVNALGRELKTELRDFKIGRSRRWKQTENPEARFSELLYKYIDHLTREDPDASADVKEKLWGESIPRVLRLPIAYMSGASFHDLSNRTITLEIMKGEIGLGSQLMASYEYEGIEYLKSSGYILFNSAEEMIHKTPIFYEYWVKSHFKKMDSVYKVVSLYFDDKKNHYIEAIEENIKKAENTI